MEKIIGQFDFKGVLKGFKPFGEGHINDTFLVITDDEGRERKYIVQRINKNLFPNVDKLINNIRLVTDFAVKKVIERGGDPDRETLNLIPLKDGSSFYEDKESGYCYRAYVFIDGATSYQVVEKSEDFYQAALAFGDFANLLAEFDASKLFVVLPDFHNTVKRFSNLEKAVKEDKCGRANSVKAEIDFAFARKGITGKIVELLESGEMPTKVTHNDTKLNNVMIDDATGKYLTVIDLDTVMPGSICYDFGDSIRFGCNPAAEDEKDLSKVNFDINLFEVFVKGYLESLADSVTKVEKDHLVWGAILMTYECGIRFLTDYLEGDTYFKTHREGQNLDRARTQFKLVSDMEANFDKLKAIVDKY